MFLIFTLCFAVLGFKIAETEGAIFGAIFGAITCSFLSIYFNKKREERHKKHTEKIVSNRVFFDCLFSMLGKLAVSDGQCSDLEIKGLEEHVFKVFKLNRKQKKYAMEVFHAATRSNTSIQFFATQFYEIFREDENTLESVVLMLFRFAISDGDLEQSEEKQIREIARLFHIKKDQYDQILSWFKRDLKSPSIQKCYEILGLSASSSIEEVRSRYRELVSQYHPDKLVSKGLPDGMIDFAEQKFIDIQNAYETIMRVSKN